MTDSPSDSPPFPTTLPECVALFEMASGHALQLLTDVDEADFARPTPCQGWNVRDLLLHMADAADTITGLMLTGRLDDTAAPRQDDPDPVKVAQERIEHLRDGLRTAMSAAGSTAGPADQADQTQWAIGAAQGGSLEFATHGWDLAAACGLDSSLPDDPAVEIFQLSRSLISEDARAPMFAPLVAAPPTAPATDRLAAYLGRNPHWHRQ